jgi:glycogen(starch) synthase
MKANADHVFEVSWEVCNKVGGIFTVVSSKAATMEEYYSGKYILVGPYFADKAAGIFEEKMPPESMHDLCNALANEGIVCHFGKWLVKGSPDAVLIDFTGYVPKKNEIKRWLWDNYGIDSLNTEYFDFDEPAVWATAAARVVEEFANRHPEEKVVAHFHEWLSGAGLLHLKKSSARVGAVFTTHATMLGRTLASQGINPAELPQGMNPEEEARSRGVLPKYQMERQCASNADVFTTVSEITGIEAENLLGVKPAVILPNGLNIEKFPSFEDASIKHKLFKQRIFDFAIYYFFPYYPFDIDNTLIFFLAGRYEFKDKGIDVYIKALSNLNKKMQAENSGKTVLAFIWVPGNIRGIKPAVLQNRSHYEDVKDSIDEEISDIRHRIIHALVSGREISKELLFSEDLEEDLKRKILMFRRGSNGNPPISTHDLYDEESDRIMNALKAEGLDNRKENRVKVVFYPIYLTGADRLLDTSYYESMMGSHLGVFPSFYEPWGYTPLEGAALGVASVTTDLSGFGRYLKTMGSKKKYHGIFVLDRFGRNDDEVVGQLTDTFYKFTAFTKHQRIQNKIAARALAERADWKIFGENYIKAHNLALKKVK